MANVQADNIETATARVARQREQNRLRQRRHVQKKKAATAQNLRPRPQDVDKAMLVAMLDMVPLGVDQRVVRHGVLKEVFKQALDSLLAAGHVQVGYAIADRCRELQKVPVKAKASSSASPTPPSTTPSHTPVTLTGSNPSPSDRIADPSPV